MITAVILAVVLAYSSDVADALHTNKNGGTHTLNRQFNNNEQNEQKYGIFAEEEYTYNSRTVLVMGTSYEDVNVVLKGHEHEYFFEGKTFDDSKEDILAVGQYQDKLMQDGWGQLRVKTMFKAPSFENFYGNNNANGNTSTDEETIYNATPIEHRGQTKSDSHSLYYYAAGYAEGYLTAEHVYDHTYNMKVYYTHETNITRAVEWFKRQVRWMDKMIKENPSDPIWLHADQVLAQTRGLYAGYKAANLQGIKGTLSFWDIYIVNAVGDLLDLPVKDGGLNATAKLAWESGTNEDFRNMLRDTEHCTGLVRVTPALDDVLISHSSWFSYSAMNRIFKHYYFDLPTPVTGASKVSFSSYPGMLNSLDDFYMMNSDMVMIQTTNSVFNMELFKQVVPESLLAWQRVRMAVTMADSGKEFAKVIDSYNSGTYNNQYIVFDFKKFEKGVALHHDSLWVIEQIPGLVVSGDQTNILRDGHFPSYNVPFYEEIYNKSGYPDMVKKRGIEFSYQMAPRAQIFRRDAEKVVDIDSMKKVMRYNDYLSDPLSRGNPANTICSRYDLEPEGKSKPTGCYDTKITNYELFKQFKATAVNGPTTGYGNLPVFQWHTSTNPDPLDSDTPHVGLPDRFDFDFVEMSAAWDEWPNWPTL